MTPFSLQENFVVVNYHYVENPRPDRTGISPCSVTEFERQIRYLAENYTISPLSELFESVKEGNDKKCAAITFDDGLRDQFDYAVPLLQKYGATATFFFITSAFEGLVPLAHKVHLISSRMTMAEIAQTFNVFLEKSFSDVSKKYYIPSNRRLTNRRLHEDAVSANVKETLILIPKEIRDAFLGRVLPDVLGGDEGAIAARLFMNGKEMRELERMGFVIGSHTHYHESLEHQDKMVFGEDAARAREVFLHYLGKPSTLISYPHGRSNKATRQVLQDFGFTHGVTIERRGISVADDPFAIPRFDTMDLKVFLDKSDKR